MLPTVSPKPVRTWSQHGTKIIIKPSQINPKIIKTKPKKTIKNGAKMEPKRLPRGSQKHIYIVHPYLLLSGPSWAPFWNPIGTPLGSIFHTFCTCLLRSFFEGLRHAIFIDFGTILASILASFLVLFSDPWI